jgi:putative spermidine/putrescine transport system substrate-binding protein
MSTMVDRRTLLIGSTASFALMGTNAARAADQLLVGTFGGDYGDMLQAQIEKPFFTTKGVEVQRDIATQDPRKAKLIAERASRRGSMDVAMMSDVDTYSMAVLNIWEPVNEKNVPNIKNVVEKLRSPHSIPHISTGMVVLYNPEKVKPAPTSFADFWDPKFRGRVGMSDITPLYNYAVAALVGGGSMSNFEQGKPKLMELKKLDVRLYSSNEALATALQSEEIWLTPMYVSRAYQWRQAGVPVRHAIPREGAIPYTSSAAVPRNAPNKDNGFKYLNYMLEPAIQVEFSRKMGYGPTVTNANLPEDLMQQVGFTPEQQERFNVPDYDYMTKNTAALMDWWNRDFKG